jgi:hypothetical protein
MKRHEVYTEYRHTAPTSNKIYKRLRLDYVIWRSGAILNNRSNLINCMKLSILQSNACLDYRVSPLPCLSTRPLSQVMPVDAVFLCNKSAVLGYTIQWALCLMSLSPPPQIQGRANITLVIQKWWIY